MFAQLLFCFYRELEKNVTATTEKEDHKYNAPSSVVNIAIMSLVKPLSSSEKQAKNGPGYKDNQGRSLFVEVRLI
jgi:hypothetical protein